MKFHNCSLTEVEKKLKGKRIIFFGGGSYLSLIADCPLIKLEDQFDYIVDNGSANYFMLNNKKYNIYSPKRLEHEKDCIIILTSSVYMYEMYMQLVDMNLPDSIECYAYPFMDLCTDNKIDLQLLESIKNIKPNKIPKIIHSFWFSGEEKPDSYKRCVESWYKKLNGYEIIEWTKENYDYNKHPFVKKAIELEAWAFASDYARLDVLNSTGGIYLDMDVEVFKCFDEFLGNDAILSFVNHGLIDLAIMGSKKNNPLTKQLLNLYDDIYIPNSRAEFTKCFQPMLVRKTLVKNGVRMDGTLQKIANATVFPSNFFMPLDTIMFRPFTKTDDTYSVHYDNFGWSFGKNNKREKKIRDNNTLWELIE